MDTAVCGTLLHSHIYQVIALQIKVVAFKVSEYNLIIFFTKPKLALADKTATFNSLGEVAVCRTA